MTTTAMSTTKTVNVAGIGPVELTVEERGEGQPFLLLHGGAGPQSVAAFAQLLAEKDRDRVLTPVHPGFGGTPRPQGLNSVAGLAVLYSGLLDELGLDDVTVIGNSVGGWIAAELALLGTPRVSGIVLLDAVGIEVESHPVADVSGLPLPEIQALSFHDPSPFRVDPPPFPMPKGRSWPPIALPSSSMPARPAMADSTLLDRLSGIAIPTLVLWGESDRIVEPAYGEAYATAKGAFEVLPLPGTCSRWRLPILFCKGFRTCKVSPLTNPKRRVVDW